MKKIKMQRFISLTLTIVMMFGLFAGVPVLANDVSTLNEWTANTYNVTTVGLSADLTPRYGSNGKFIAPIDPPVAGSIPISNRAELEAIKDNLSGSYHLVNDIDLAGADWVPIGNESNPFSGIFDGQGYVIRNMTITGEGYEYSGLFGYLNRRGLSYYATVINVGLENTYIDINNVSSSIFDIIDAGAICGYSRYEGVLIKNCYNTGKINVGGSVNVGGICGYGYSATITNCYNSANISGARSYGISGGNARFNNCYNTGEIYSDAGLAAGIGKSGFFDNCFNIGNISSYSSGSAHAGGICANVQGATINNCYNTGNVTAIADSTIARAGGILNWGSKVTNCYNTGNVLAQLNTTVSSSMVNSRYAMAGSINGSSTNNADNCYYNGDISAISKNNSASIYENGTLLSSAQMKDATNFAGFDFDTVWAIAPNVNNGFPYLRDMPIGIGESGDSNKIYQYLLKNNADLLFGRYNFAVTYVNDVPWTTVFGYGVANAEDIWKAIIYGTFSGTNPDIMSNIAEIYMNNPFKVEAMLRKIVNKMCNNEDFKYFSSQDKDAFKVYFSILAKKSGYDEIAEFYKFLENCFKGSEEALKWAADYSSNIAILEALKLNTASDSLLYKTIDQLIIAYDDQIIGTIEDWSIKKLESALVKLTQGGQFMFLNDAINATLGRAPGLDGLDTVISLSTIKGDAIAAFRRVSSKIISGSYTEDNIENYKITFDVCKALLITEYTAMSQNYKTDSEESQYLINQIKNLEDMTYDNFIHAEPFIRTAKSQTKFLGIFCPVDIDILNSSGIVIARFVDNQPIYLNDGENELALYTIDDKKYIILNANKQYSFNFTATDNGTMDFIMRDFEIYSDVPGAEKSFENVALITGKQMLSLVSDIIATPDVKLYIVSNNQIIGEILENGIETIIKGDLNGNGKADIEDAQIYLEYLVGNRTLTDAQKSALKLAVEDYDNGDSAIKKLRAFLNFITKQE